VLLSLVALLQKGGAVATVPLLTRVLGTADYGAALVIQHALVLVSLAVSCGLDVAVVALVAEAGDRASGARLGAAGLALRIAVYLLTATAIALFAGPLAAMLLPGMAPAAAIQLAAVGLVPTILVVHANQLLQGERRHRTRAGLDLLYNALLIATLVLAVGVFQAGLAGMFWPPLVAGAALAPAYLYAARGAWHAPIDRAAIGTLVRFGLPTVPAGLSLAAMAAAGPLMLNALIGPTEAGLFGIAVTLANAIHLVGVPFQQAWLPFVHAEHNDPLAHARFGRAVGAATAALAVAACAIALFAPQLLAVFVGSAFRDAAALVPPVVFAVAAGSAAPVLSVGLGLARMLSTKAAASVLAATMYAAALLVVVPRAGGRGAAFLLLITETGLAVALTFLAWRKARLPMPFRGIAWVWLVALACGQAAAWLPEHGFAALTIRLLILLPVAALPIATGLVRPGDFGHLHRVLGRSLSTASRKVPH
jgi:O-antigen/teichoic acid export membrane protein